MIEKNSYALTRHLVRACLKLLQGTSLNILSSKSYHLYLDFFKLFFKLKYNKNSFISTSDPVINGN